MDNILFANKLINEKFLFSEDKNFVLEQLRNVIYLLEGDYKDLAEYALEEDKSDVINEINYLINSIVAGHEEPDSAQDLFSDIAYEAFGDYEDWCVEQNNAGEEPIGWHNVFLGNH